MCACAHMTAVPWATSSHVSSVLAVIEQPPSAPSPVQLGAVVTGISFEMRGHQVSWNGFCSLRHSVVHWAIQLNCIPQPNPSVHPYHTKAVGMQPGTLDYNHNLVKLYTHPQLCGLLLMPLKGFWGHAPLKFRLSGGPKMLEINY